MNAHNYQWIRPAFLMSMVTVLLIVILTLSYSNKQAAVQYLVNTAQISSSLQQLDAQVLVTSTVINTLGEHLGADDFIVLQEAVHTVLQLRNSLHKLIAAAGGLKQFLMNAEHAHQLYLQGGESYVRARAIIQKNWDRLPPETQQTLAQFDAQANTLDTAIKQMMITPGGTDITQAIKDIITVSTTAVKLLALAGVL